MLKIKEGEPWIMWPDNMVTNFIGFPANKIFEYDGNYSFWLTFGLPNELQNKSTLFAKLPTYFGIDLEKTGITLIFTGDDRKTEYRYTGFDWEIGRAYELQITKNDDILTVYIDASVVFQEILEKKIGGDNNSHIIFGAGNFPKNGFNLNYFSVNLIELKIEKESEVICKHDFEKFIHNKSLDVTNNCNFIHKL